MDTGEGHNGAGALKKYGRENPNFKNAGHRVCEKCGGGYFSYDSARKYCSHACYTANRQLPKQEPIRFGGHKTKRKCRYCDAAMGDNPRLQTCGAKPCRARHFESTLGPKPVSTCQHCGEEFTHHRSQTRLYCSYDCHIADGGAQRAGRAASMAKMRYGAKKDANHAELVGALQKMGVQVIDTSAMGGGFPDLICGIRRQTFLVEIKNRKTGYGRRGLNKLQREFAEKWTGGPVYIIDSLKDAESLASYKLDHLWCYGGYDNVNVPNVTKLK